MSLRPYQQRAVDTAINWIKKTTDPCCMELATGAGKSHVIAAIAKWITDVSHKKVLCLAPNGELVQQNYAKFIAAGYPASIFSASGGDKSTRHDVVFGSPLTVKNDLKRFDNYAAIIIDECHGLTPTLFSIIDAMKKTNINLRVIGLTATPYRMNTGYIYEHHYASGAVSEDETINPYFKMLVCQVPAWELIELGYLTRPNLNHSNINYDTSGVVFTDQSTIDRAFVGHGRLTAQIVGDVVNKSRDRKGVMFFASTVAHAKEIAASLPSELTGIVTTKTTERSEIIQVFKRQKLKYLVNVSCLTTGFDAPHVDVIAILRATESCGLYQQIIGRGLRLCKGKKDVLILDYAENIKRHFPDGDIFAPQIKTSNKKDSENMDVKCPLCGYINQFAARANPDGYKYDKHGNFVDLDGNVIMAGHYGRRCNGGSIINAQYERCPHMWECKECPECGAENDIAARYCSKCKKEIIDPNEKLRREAEALANSPYATKNCPIGYISMSKYTSERSGKTTLKINYTLNDDKATIITEWLSLSYMSHRLKQIGIQATTIDEALQQKPNWKDKILWYRREKGNRYHKVVQVST